MYTIIEREDRYGLVEQTCFRGFNQEQVKRWIEHYQNPRYISVKGVEVGTFNHDLFTEWVVVNTGNVPLNIQAYRIWQDLALSQMNLAGLHDLTSSTWLASTSKLLDGDNIMRQALNIPDNEPILKNFLRSDK